MAFGASSLGSGLKNHFYYMEMSEFVYICIELFEEIQRKT